jgi:hypothetical protein
MTESQPSPSVDELALRLIMSMLNDDYDITNATLTAINAAVADNPRDLSHVCCALAARSVSTLTALGEYMHDPDFGLRTIQSWLQKELDDRNHGSSK